MPNMTRIGSDLRRGRMNTEFDGQLLEIYASNVQACWSLG